MRAGLNGAALGAAPLVAFALLFLAAGLAAPARGAEAEAVTLKPLVEGALQLAGLVLVAVVGVLARRALAWLGVAEADKLGQRIQTAAEYAVHYGIGKAGAALDGTPLAAPIRSAVLGHAALYVQEHVPDALRALGVTEEGVARMVEARLSALIGSGPRVVSFTSLGEEPAELVAPAAPAAGRGLGAVAALALGLGLALSACAGKPAPGDPAQPVPAVAPGAQSAPAMAPGAQSAPAMAAAVDAVLDVAPKIAAAVAPRDMLAAVDAAIADPDRRKAEATLCAMFGVADAAVRVGRELGMVTGGAATVADRVGAVVRPLCDGPPPATLEEAAERVRRIVPELLALAAVVPG